MKNKMTIKKLKAVVVGYGNRGQVYADYSLDCPDELGIAAVVDPNEFKTMGRATPFTGMELFGRCLLTMKDGRIVWQEEEK